MAFSNGSFVHMLFVFVIGVQITFVDFCLGCDAFEEANSHGQSWI
jgi:hypothetical protein